MASEAGAYTEVASRVAIYTRVSTEEQAREGYSLASQAADCLAYAEARGWTVVGLFSDPGVSGATENRPGLDQVMALARTRGFDVLLTARFDRLYRIVEFQKRARRELAELDISWRSVTENIDIATSQGNLHHSIAATFAEWERDLIRERTTAGRRRKAESGKMQCHPIDPYGYHVIHKSEAVGEWAGRAGEVVIVEREAEIVRRVFALYHAGWTLWKITELLNTEGVPTRRGAPWRPATFRRVMRNPTYTGIAYYSRSRSVLYTDAEGVRRRTQVDKPESEWIAVPVPPLIPQTVWDAVQERLDSGRRLRSGNPGRAYALSGLLACSKCGRYYRGRTTAEGKRIYVPRVCDGPGDPNSARCNGRRQSANETERRVLDIIAADLTPQFIRDVVQHQQSITRETPEGRQQLEDRITRLSGDIRRLTLRETQEPDAADMIAEVRRQKTAERKALLLALGRLAEAPDLGAPVNQKNLAEVCDGILSRLPQYVEGPPSDLREFLNTFVSRVDITPDGALQVILRGELFTSSTQRYKLTLPPTLPGKE